MCLSYCPLPYRGKISQHYAVCLVNLGCKSKQRPSMLDPECSTGSPAQLVIHWQVLCCDPSCLRLCGMSTSSALCSFSAGCHFCHCHWWSVILYPEVQASRGSIGLQRNMTKAKCPVLPEIIWLDETGLYNVFV